MDPQQSSPSSALQKPPPAKNKVLLSSIPEKYLNDPLLNSAINILPPHYNFQIPKTLHRIDSLAEQLAVSSLSVSLQFPQGLMMFACIISDILTTFAGVSLETVILGDVTYGACCVDDLASEQMGCQLLVHYGHSCLIPVTATHKRLLYIFVEIQIDIDHFVQTVAYNLPPDTKIHLMGTIQFNNSLFLARQMLQQHGFNDIVIPQEKPRSAGEVLGCTSPRLEVHPNSNIVIFLCDGRFHMEAVMIANPQYTFYQYDPYTRSMTEEKYATECMLARREEQISKAKNGSTKIVCIIFGALGRQGNTGILDRLIAKIDSTKLYSSIVLIASEINIELMQMLQVDFFVQIACPRLSIDWAYGTPKPLLTPYELFALVDSIDIKVNYSMDYYSLNGGPWSNFYGRSQPKKSLAKQAAKIKLKLEENCCESPDSCHCSKSKRQP